MITRPESSYVIRGGIEGRERLKLLSRIMHLPLLLRRNGFADINVMVVQPMGLDGEVKLITPLTLENIADAVIQEELATREEISVLVEELYSFVAKPETLAGLPRVVQTWARLTIPVR